MSESELGDAGWIAQVHGLRRLAHVLVHDQGDADDLLQETWLRATQAREEAPSRVSSWLGMIMRNVVRRNRRDRERRERRERASARTEALPSAADHVERDEELRCLTDALRALDPSALFFRD